MLPSFTVKPPQYSPLGADATDERKPGHCYEIAADQEKKSNQNARLHLVVPWMISVVLLSLLAFQHTQSKVETSKCDGNWSPYEIKAAVREIPLKMKAVKFTGTLKIVDGLGLIREVDQRLPDFVGAPSPELDAAWDDIVHPLNVFVTEEELEGDKNGTSADPETGLYVAMPQGFHDLHCLNMIRKRLHLKYYTDLATMNQSVLDVHIDHCIDSLRQSLMCTGDMTLIKTFWIKSRQRMMADFDNTHMCRDFEALKMWSRARDAEDGSTWRQSADRLLKGT